MIRGPIRDLPLCITAIADAHVAVARISKLLSAEDRPAAYTIDAEQENAIEAVGDFTFESSPEEDAAANGKEKASSSLSASANPELSAESQSRSPFQLRDVQLKIPKGSFVCIMGRIASGKSALLQALLGDMRPIRGKVTFGGTVSLATQSPWIQSTSIRDNILFGTQLNSPRFATVVNACALASHVRDLPDGLDTEIGGQ